MIYPRYLLLVLVLPGLAAAQIDRSCVHEISSNIQFQIDNVSSRLHPDAAQKVQSQFKQFEQRRLVLDQQASAVEAEYRAAWEQLRQQAGERGVAQGRISEALARRAVTSPRFDNANSELIHLQVFGYNTTEGQQLSVAKSLPISAFEYRTKLETVVPRLGASLPAHESSQVENSSALKQLLVVAEASRRAGRGQSIEDWMITTPPSVVTEMESQHADACAGFDCKELNSVATEYRDLMAKIRARQDRITLDLALLPRFLPPAVVRQTWAREQGALMPKTRTEANSTAARVLRDIEKVQAPRKLFRNVPPPPPPPPSSASPLKTWTEQTESYIKKADETLKKITYVLED